ncbi:MAG: hypothetical protein MUE55_05280 [Thermoplasmata archaeon]|jgi:hypothetical protein|nr:hypothetical protein [Thermoplasmata archaeon]
MFVIRRPRVFIMECIPKSDEYREGDVLFKFLEMTDPKDIAVKDFSTKSEFLGHLRRKRNLDGFNFIHLSGHGDPKRCAFELPLGLVAPDEFPPKCFEGRRVALSACGLSRREFIEPFMEATGAKAVIAPRKDVRFDDAAIWYLNYYYLMLHHRFTSMGAFDRVNDTLCYGPRRGRVKGAFEHWS